MKAIETLVARGRYIVCPPLRACYCPGQEEGLNRKVVSVPKKLFKRAVKRNLLKRRIREAYRTHKTMLSHCGIDMMFVFTSKEVADYQTIVSSMENILSQIEERLSRPTQA